MASASSATQVRVVFSEQSEDSLNIQINNELYGFYVYQAMASWCGRDDVALHGLRDYCLKSADEELNDARGLIDYMSRKGGIVKYSNIPSPAESENAIPKWINAIQVMETMLNLEKRNYQSLLTLHGIASSARDNEMEDFLEERYLKQQVSDIKKIADLLTNLRRVGGEGVGLFIWDQKLRKAYRYYSGSSMFSRRASDILPNPFSTN